MTKHEGTEKIRAQFQKRSHALETTHLGGSAFESGSVCESLHDAAILSESTTSDGTNSANPLHSTKSLPHRSPPITKLRD